MEINKVELSKELMGMTEKQAEAFLETKQMPCRVVNRDGEEFMRSMDYNGSRVNLTLKNNQVVGVEFG